VLEEKSNSRHVAPPGGVNKWALGPHGIGHEVRVRPGLQARFDPLKIAVLGLLEQRDVGFDWRSRRERGTVVRPAATSGHTDANDERQCFQPMLNWVGCHGPLGSHSADGALFAPPTYCALPRAVLPAPPYQTCYRRVVARSLAAFYRRVTISRPAPEPARPIVPGLPTSNRESPSPRCSLRQHRSQLPQDRVPLGGRRQAAGPFKDGKPSTVDRARIDDVQIRRDQVGITDRDRLAKVVRLHRSSAAVQDVGFRNLGTPS